MIGMTMVVRHPRVFVRATEYGAIGELRYRGRQRQSALGHDPAITLRVYGHVYDALASAGDALLGRSRASNAE